METIIFVFKTKWKSVTACNPVTKPSHLSPKTIRKRRRGLQQYIVGGRRVRRKRNQLSISEGGYISPARPVRFQCSPGQSYSREMPDITLSAERHKRNPTPRFTRDEILMPERTQEIKQKKWVVHRPHYRLQVILSICSLHLEDLNMLGRQRGRRRAGLWGDIVFIADEGL